MKNKFFKILISLFSIILILQSFLPVLSAESSNKANEIIDSIIEFKLAQNNAESVQEWIDSGLCDNAGNSAEWYIITLSQYGDYNFKSYQNSLLSYLDKNNVGSASTRLKNAMALISTGSTDIYIAQVLENSIGEQGLMSFIYGLHILNNGYESSIYTKEDVMKKILSLQKNDGGWALTGSFSDADITAMAIQALAPYYSFENEIKTAIDKAVTFLSSKQLNDGDFSSYGVPCAESTAQVIAALSALGINCIADSSFIKNGKTLFDGLLKYQLPSGSFCHKAGGKFNETATVQAFYSLLSYNRMNSKKSAFYIFDKRNPEKLEILPPPSENSSSIPGSTTPSETVSDSSKPEQNTVSKENVSSETHVSEPSVSLDTQSTESSLETPQNKTENIVNTPAKKGFSYKFWAIIAVFGLSVTAIIILIILKKRNLKNFIAVIISASILIILILVTNFQSADSYYGSSSQKQNAKGYVTMSISCEKIAEKPDNKYIPKDGIILKEQQIPIADGDTVYDILVEAARKNSIHIEKSGSDGMIYINAINYIYEFGFGDLSGWVYTVNGKSPSVGCDEYILSDGDAIEWIYSLELGNDLK